MTEKEIKIKVFDFDDWNFTIDPAGAFKGYCMKENMEDDDFDLIGYNIEVKVAATCLHYAQDREKNPDFHYLQTHEFEVNVRTTKKEDKNVKTQD